MPETEAAGHASTAASVEAARLAALRTYQVMDTPPEDDFDDVSRLAAHVCSTPLAMVSLVDEHRQWAKSGVGIEQGSLPRDVAFCNLVVRSGELLVVADLSADERFVQHPLVVAGPQVRFYAGAPMTNSDGHVLGTVCVLDVVPRELDQAQREMLRSLARQAVRLLELRHHAAVLQDEKHFQDAVLAASPDLIFVVDPRTNRTRWSSSSLVDLLGWSEDEMRDLGDSAIPTVVHPDDRVRLLAANSAVQDLDDGEVVQIRHRALHASGGYRWMSRRVTPFARDAAGRVTEILGVTRDVTASVEAEQQLRDAALHDPLTGLPNRVLLADRLANALARNARAGHQLAVLFVDLDGFKRVNDSGGHAAGDAVLVATAERLQAALRSEDSVARVGGDEFVLLLEPTPVPHHFGEGEQVDVQADALSVAERVKAALAQPFSYGGRSYAVSASIGVCVADPGTTPDHVLHDADIAMYRAKSAGKDRHELFVAGMTASVSAGVPRQGQHSMLPD